MKKRDKKMLSAIVAILLLAVIVWAATTKKGGNQTQTNTPTGTNKKTTTTSATSGVWTGILKQSDNMSKGSIMLVTSSKTYYIQTSRNYSSLFGKEVNLSYEGSPSNFTVKQIVAK